MDLTDRPADAAAPHQLSPQERAGDELLARALRRARWTIFWERLWPALASLATVIGLFLALSWLGLWLWLPPAGRAIGLGIFFLLTAAAFVPVLMLRVPSRIEGLRRLDRNSGLPHRPATAIADEIAAPTEDSYSVALWRAHIERALRAAKTLKAGTPMPRLARRDPFAVRALVAVLVVATFFAAGGERMKRIAAAFDWQGVMMPANFRIDAWVSPPPYTGRPPVILPGLRPGEPVQSAAALSVPAGSVLVIRGFLFGRAVACPYRTRPARGQDAQGRDSNAAARAARPLRRARLGGGVGGCDVLRGRRRTDEAHRRCVRLAGRDDAGQFPHRCLGEPAALYRPPAGDPAGPAAGRAGTERRRPFGAGGKRAGHPRDRNSPRCGRKRRTCRAFLRRAKQQRQGHRGAALRHQRRRGGDRSRRRRERRHLAVHRHPGQAADHRARQGAGRPGARSVAALLQARGRLRRHRRAGDVQAAQQRGNQRPPRATALRRARLPAGAAAGAQQERGRTEHQRFDRASLGGHRRGDDPDRTRRGRQ